MLRLVCNCRLGRVFVAASVPVVRVGGSGLRWQSGISDSKKSQQLLEDYFAAEENLAPSQPKTDSNRLSFNRSGHSDDMLWLQDLPEGAKRTDESSGYLESDSEPQNSHHVDAAINKDDLVEVVYGKSTQQARQNRIDIHQEMQEDLSVNNLGILEEMDAPIAFEEEISKFLESYPKANDMEDNDHDSIDKIAEMAMNHLDEKKTDQNEFLELMKSSKLKSEMEQIEQERALFSDVFNKYMDQDYNDPGIDKLLTPSSVVTKNKINDLIMRVGILTPAFQLTEELAVKTKNSLVKTIEWMQTQASMRELVSLLTTIHSKWAEVARENGPGFFLSHLLAGESNTPEETEKVLCHISAKSAQDPLNFELNVLTLPIVCNEMLKTFAYKFNEPQLALTVFNTMRSDIKFSSVACNQDSYNQALKLTWVFFGKTSLNRIESLFSNMIKGGFNGDIATFNVLKQILIDYYHMRDGISPFDGRSKINPFSSVSDDRRAAVLEKELRSMGERIENS